MNKPKKILILVLLAALGMGAWLFFSAPAEGGLVLYGNVDQRQVELAFIDTERLEEVLVQEGMEVQPGQVLARLETRRLRDRMAVAGAQVDSAEAELEFAQAQYKRYNDIWKSSRGQAVSRQDLDEAQLQLNVALAVLQERRRALEELNNRLGDAELKSPAHSVVNRRLLEPGDMASPQRAVFSLAVLSPKWVRAYVSEVDLGRIRPGLEAVVYTDSHPDEGLPGSVGFISPVAEFTPKAVETTDLRTSLVYEVRVCLEDPQNRLRLGMPATVRFPGLAD